MKSREKWIGIMIPSLIISVIVTWFFSLELNSSNELLDKIALVQPGMNLNSVKAKLGQQMYDMTDPEQIEHLGSVKDPSFYKGKKLYWFEGSKWPARALEVYTDKNDIVVYVSWQGL